jgi:hypothetical protein
MSFEGYYQLLCSKGHLTEADVMTIDDNPLKERCYCGAEMIYYNLVDTTNGSYDDSTGERIDNYVHFKIKQVSMCPTCNHPFETLYKLPEGESNVE